MFSEKVLFCYLAVASYRKIDSRLHPKVFLPKMMSYQISFEWSRFSYDRLCGCHRVKEIFRDFFSRISSLLRVMNSIYNVCQKYSSAIFRGPFLHHLERDFFIENGKKMSDAETAWIIFVWSKNNFILARLMSILWFFLFLALFLKCLLHVIWFRIFSTLNGDTFDCEVLPKPRTHCGLLPKKTGSLKKQTVEF